jgi:nuclear transport factor 2 (NTF2) superfamily protein
MLNEDSLNRNALRILKRQQHIQRKFNTRKTKESQYKAIKKLNIKKAGRCIERPAFHL